MNPEFFDRLEIALASERLDAYRHDGAEPLITLARYLWNMALCESLYSPLQTAEIALRNALHRALENRFNTPDWYDAPECWNILSQVQQSSVTDAKRTLASQGKVVSPGRIVAELTFGFWTTFFNKRFAQEQVVVHLMSTVFHTAPKPERDLRKLNKRWTSIRGLRNRVFHHERIVHWTDLDAKHAMILEVIGWISPELHEMALALDRFCQIRKEGLTPWIQKLRQHWPHGK